MTEHALQFQRIQIHRVPGVPRGHGFTFEAFSPGINIIHGPNGSGKTTTARVIQQLLWPQENSLIARPSIVGTFRVNGDAWQIDLDAGHLTCARNGQGGAAPELGSPDVRHRYHLALHELIHHHDAAFAKAVGDAMQGGFDVNAAAEVLGFRDPPPSRRQQRRELEQHAAHRRNAEQIQAALRGRARERDELIKLRGQAAAAAANLDRLTRARNYLAALEQHKQVRVQLLSFPEGFAHLRGDERRRLDQLARQRQQLLAEQQHHAHHLHEAREQLAAAALPEAGVSDQTCRTLRSHRDRLADLQRQIDEQQRAHANHQKQADRARERLGEQMSDAQLAQLDRIEVDELGDFARRVERARAQQAVLDERCRWLRDELATLNGEGAVDQAPDADALREGLSLLGRWLASPGDAPQAVRLRWPAVVLAAVGVALALVLAATAHPMWVAAAIIGPTVLGIDWWRSRVAAAASTGPGARRQTYQQDYAQLAAPAPASWTAEAVAERVQSLGRSLARRTLAQQCADRMSALEHEQRLADAAQAAISQQRGALEQRLGAALKIDDAWLAALVEQLVRWRACADEAAGAAAALDALRSELRQTCSAMREMLRPLGYDTISTAEAAREVVADVEARVQRHRDASRTLRDAGDAEAKHVRALAENEQARRATFEQLGLDAGDDAALDDWLERHESYRQLATELHRSQGACDAAAEALAGHEHLMELSRDQLEEQIEQNRALAERRDELQKQIAEIESEIAQAKRGQELAEALRAEQACVDAFVEVRELDARQAVGAMLAEQVRRVSADRAQPAVFKRASELFVRITHGRYKLELIDAQPPAFAAYDQVHEVRKSLSELSVGERVQLLLAVRLGFVEQQERGLKLPIVMDETLGTSDDQRAGAIMDAVIELARGGRQVFYFTAQADEVGKWQARLTERNVPHRLTDLRTLRVGAAADLRPLRVSNVELPAAPAPGQMSREEYAKMLGVPGLDPAIMTLGQVHLWHVVHEPGCLHQLLSRGITQWGELQTLLEHGGGALLGADHEAVHVRARAAARVIEAAMNAWRIGRGRPIDRAVLQDSGAVSGTFIDELTVLTEKLRGDGGKLLESLEAGYVARWRENKTQQLREYLEEQGYLDARPRLDAKQIRLQVMGIAAQDVADGRVDSEWVDQMLASLPG